MAAHLGLKSPSSPSLAAPLPMRTAWVSMAGVWCLPVTFEGVMGYIELCLSVIIFNKPF